MTRFAALALRRLAALVGALSFAASCALPRDDAAVVETADGGVFFAAAAQRPLRAHGVAFGLSARVLRDDERTGSALRVAVPSGWRADALAPLLRPTEYYVIDGGVTIAGIALAAGDFLRLPRGTESGPAVSDRGAALLVFADADETGDRTPFVVRGADVGWVAGTAMRDAGRDDVPLEILHLRNDPETGARSYLVRVRPGLSIPWEVHSVAEEAFVIDGDFTLAECLDGVERVHEYRAGGYFYRPPGIAHNGPASGSRTGVTMLIRTPAPLTVELVDGCPPGGDP